jgi:hypothetical protein
VTRDEFNRRNFLRAAGASVVAGALFPACDLASPSTESAEWQQFFEADFSTVNEEWPEQWINVRYETPVRRFGGLGRIRLDRAPRMAVDDTRLQMHYMGHPLILSNMQVEDTIVGTVLQLKGNLEAGVIARWRWDEAYALMLSSRAVSLYRYDPSDRKVMARRQIRGSAGRRELELHIVGNQLTGRVSDPRGPLEVELRAQDDHPLQAGAVGVLANAVDAKAPASVGFTSFTAQSKEDPQPDSVAFAYRFAGAIEGHGDGYRARVSARTVIPAPVAFEISEDDGFSNSRTIGPTQPSGDLGSVQNWIEGLRADATYYWRPLAGPEDRPVAGPVASFRTPPGAGSPVRFAFGSCTSGRVPTYPSFALAAKSNPHFYLHAGDFGYANINSQAQKPDHMQSRWIRLLRSDGMDRLIKATPLLFWQDDHDYQSDNGWSKTIDPRMVKGFDEFHANPTDVYFDVRWGDVHVWCLDCRLFASDPEAPDGPSKTRIGFEQKKWLKGSMTASDAPVKIVASAMAFRNKAPEDPGWHSVYAHERDELLDFFSSLDATVLILSGDAHGHRLIHHYEFGELYEITASRTDFRAGEGIQPNLDPDHTVINFSDRTGFALVSLDGTGEDRTLRAEVIDTERGTPMFQKSLPVR